MCLGLLVGPSILICETRHVSGASATAYEEACWASLYLGCTCQIDFEKRKLAK